MTKEKIMQKLEGMENSIIEKETKPEDGKCVRLGVIGCGKMTLYGHIHAFDRLENAKITALCDIRIEAAKEIAEKCEACKNAFITDNYEELLPHVDAVLVVLPHAVHYPCGKFFLENGKHVLMEKPLANTYEECVALAELADKNDLKLMVAYPVPYKDGVVKLKEELDSGKYGRIIQMSIWTEQYTEYPGTIAHLGGGQLFSHGCHYIDLFLRFLGKPLSGFHMGSNLGTPWMEREGTSNVVIQFENGAMGYHFGTWGARGSSHEYNIQIHCEHGFFDYRMKEGLLKFVCDRGPDSTSGNYPRESVWHFDCSDDAAKKQTYREINHFADCILNDKYPLTDAWSAIESNRLIWKLYEAEENGIVADLSDIKARTEYLEVLNG